MIDRRLARSKEHPVAPPPSPPELEEAAETVRSHLVTLRGGAPFLSPADSELLARWLDDGVTVARILAALEKVAENRQKRPTRLPFTLAKAARHLGAKPSSARRAPDPRGPAALAAQIEASAAGDPHRDALLRAAAALRALPEADPAILADHALRILRSFHEEAWSGLSPDARDAALTRAREELGDLVEVLPPEAVDASAEELARGALRRRYPLLSVAALEGCLGPAPFAPRS
jgi:hypothetical protein